MLDTGWLKEELPYFYAESILGKIIYFLSEVGPKKAEVQPI